MTLGPRRRPGAPTPALMPVALALAAAGSSCSTLDSTQRQRLLVFDTYWEALRDDYPYFGRKSIDWDEVGKQYRAVVPAAESAIDFYHVLAGMLCELNDAHVSLDVPRQSLATVGAAPTSLDDREGFSLTRIGSGVYVTSWPDDEEPVPPEHLPLELRTLPEIVRVEGFDVAWSLADLLFAGSPGSPCELLLRWHDGTRTHHVLRRPGSTGAPRTITIRPGMRPSIDDKVVFEPRADCGYLRIRDFNCDGEDGFKAFARDSDAAVDAAIAHGRDLVIDLRGNGGGHFGAALMLAGRFLQTPIRLIEDVPDESYLLGLVTYSYFATWVAQPREPHFGRKLAVLVDRSSASAAEHFARLLQLRGAILIGEQTLGAEAYLREVKGADGSVLKFGARSILDERGRRLQDEGVFPDVAVPLRWDDVRTMGPAAARKAWTENLLRAAQDALAGRRAAAAAARPGSLARSEQRGHSTTLRTAAPTPTSATTTAVANSTR